MLCSTTFLETRELRGNLSLSHKHKNIELKCSFKTSYGDQSVECIHFVLVTMRMPHLGLFVVIICRVCSVRNVSQASSYIFVLLSQYFSKQFSESFI